MKKGILIVFALYLVACVLYIIYMAPPEHKYEELKLARDSIELLELIAE